MKALVLHPRDGSVQVEDIPTPVPGLTAAQTISGRLGIPGPFGNDLGKGDAFNGHKPEDGPVNIFIYGSRTSLGLRGLLRQQPYEYDVPVDYRDSDWPGKVRAATGGRGVEIAMDCISEGDTVRKVDSKFGAKGENRRPGIG
ncbi:hypothetical protein F5Y11DRAFT_343499 [Daldinia sp. FL1419]|nr:hypothetical protein F5Y11DRAFT_343499 [Daldinia sp. FL1419]